MTDSPSGKRVAIVLMDDPHTALAQYRALFPQPAALWAPQGDPTPRKWHDEISSFADLERLMTVLPEWSPYPPPIRPNYATLSDTRGAREGWLSLMYGKPLPPHRGHVVPPPPPLTKRQRRRRRGKSRS